MSSPRILVLGLNPAWQKTLLFPELHLGEVNRAARAFARAGGKGIHCAYAVQQGGGRATVAQFAGGTTGAWLCQDLDERQLAHVTVTTAAVTRVCTTLVSENPSQMTELIEPSGEITAAELATFRQTVLVRLPEFAGVAICGTFPPGVPATLYAEVATAARQQGAVVLLDGYRNVVAALAAGVDVLKINRAELAELGGVPEPAAAAANLLARYAVTWLAVTAGPATAWLFRRGVAWEFSLPVLEKVINPLGAGDCADGTLLLRLLAGGQGRAVLEQPEAVCAAWADALAAASASCQNPEPAGFAAAAAAEIRRRIAWNSLPNAAERRRAQSNASDSVL